MKGHNYGNVSCKKCGKIHQSPKGMLGMKGSCGMLGKRGRKGRTGKHHSQITKDNMSKNRTGNLNSNWKGGVLMLDGYKYIWCPAHPNATQNGYVCEHRLIMEKKINRFLDTNEVVHHKDNNRLNNSINNLVLFSSAGRHFIEEHLEKRNETGRFC